MYFNNFVFCSLKSFLKFLDSLSCLYTYVWTYVFYLHIKNITIKNSWIFSSMFVCLFQVSRRLTVIHTHYYWKIFILYNACKNKTFCLTVRNIVHYLSNLKMQLLKFFKQSLCLSTFFFSWNLSLHVICTYLMYVRFTAVNLN